MLKIGNKYKRLIYSFEFSDNSVYVGLTYNSSDRKNEHLNPKRSKKSAVYKYILLTGLIPKYLELTEYVDCEIAVKLEEEFLNRYKANGWKILNVYKTGTLGGNTLFWTKDKCIEEAKKYLTIKEWRLKSNSVYCTAIKRGWIEECTKHMVYTYNKWTKDKCVEEAKKYITIKEWRKNSEGAYKASRKNDWMIDCCSHMKTFKRK